jgi:hypothetical protein
MKTPPTRSQAPTLDNPLKEKCDMNNTYLNSEVTTLSAVGTMEVINPAAEPATGRIAYGDQHVESAQSTTQRISQPETVSAARKARRWYQRLLDIAAHNPPHLL